MNRYQRIAWFNPVVIAATILVTSAAVAVEVHIRGYSTIGPWFVALLALLKLTPYLFKKPRSSNAVVSDERDDFIVKRAVLHAWEEYRADDHIAADGSRSRTVSEDCVLGCHLDRVRPGKRRP